jgi:hypothetical protein
MTRIVCRASDCIFWDEGVCSSEEITYDPENGCLTYEGIEDALLEDDTEWDEEELLDEEPLDWDEEDDDDELMDDEEDEDWEE